VHWASAFNYTGYTYYDPYSGDTPSNIPEMFIPINIINPPELVCVSSQDLKGGGKGL